MAAPAQQSAPFPKQATFEENFSRKMSFGVGAASATGGTEYRTARVIKIFDELSKRSIGVVVSSYDELVTAIKKRFPDFDEKRYLITQLDKENTEIDNDAYFQTIPTGSFLRILKAPSASPFTIYVAVDDFGEDRAYAVRNVNPSDTVRELKTKFLESFSVRASFLHQGTVSQGKFYVGLAGYCMHKTRSFASYGIQNEQVLQFIPYECVVCQGSQQRCDQCKEFEQYLLSH